MKLCKDCKFYEKSDFDDDERFDKCLNQSFGVLDVIRGKRIGFAKIAREHEFACGKDAKGFEQRPPEPPKKTWMQRATAFLKVIGRFRE